MKKLRLWVIEKLFNLWLAWERRKESKNERAEREAHLKGTPGTRYVEVKPTGKTAGRVRAKKGKVRIH